MRWFRSKPEAAPKSRYPVTHTLEVKMKEGRWFSVSTNSIRGMSGQFAYRDFVKWFHARQKSKTFFCRVANGGFGIKRDQISFYQIKSVDTEAELTP